MDATDATGRNTPLITLREATVRGAAKHVVFSRINGIEKRTFFPTRLEASLHRDALLTKLQARGTEAFEQAAGMTVAQVWREFNLVRMPKLKEGNHKRLLLWWWGKFVAEYGPMDLCDIKPGHIDRFLTRPEWTGTTAKQGFDYLRLVWNWAERFDFATRNPVLKIDVPVRTTTHHLLTPKNVERLLDLTASKNRLRAWLVLGVFGGMRTSEVWRAKPEHVEEAEILVPQIKSTDPVPRKRYVPILPALRRHLPADWDCLEEDFIKRGRTALAEKMKWEEWPQNCLRHTAASMHLAMWQDAGKTAFFLGHSSPQMVNKTYARAVRQAEAERFWGL